MSTNLPNLLTLSRILVIPVLCLLLAFDRPGFDWLALALYAYACLTDFFDGYLARRYRQLSRFGEMLDPIADKLLVASLLLILVGIDRIEGLALIPSLVILCREMVVSGLREFLAHVSVSVPVSRLAKWKTTLQMLALGFLVIGTGAPALGAITMTDLGVAGLWLAALLTLITGYDYLRASVVHLGGAPVAAAPIADGALAMPPPRPLDAEHA